MEPKPVIALNNLEARLDAAESEEEERVLARLSEVVAANAASILQARTCSVSALFLTQPPTHNENCRGPPLTAGLFKSICSGQATASCWTNVVLVSWTMRWAKHRDGSWASCPRLWPPLLPPPSSFAGYLISQLFHLAHVGQHWGSAAFLAHKSPAQPL